MSKAFIYMNLAILYALTFNNFLLSLRNNTLFNWLFQTTSIVESILVKSIERRDSRSNEVQSEPPIE